jgi:hypothetical protein
MVFLNLIFSVIVLFALATFAGMVIGVIESVLYSESPRSGEILPGRATERAIEAFIVAAVLDLGVLIGCDHMPLQAVGILSLVCAAVFPVLCLAACLATLLWYTCVFFCSCLYHVLKFILFCFERFNAFILFICRKLWRCFG